MISLAAAALLNAGAQAPASPDQLPNLFVAACLDGSVRLSADDARPIQFGQLPDGLRSRLGSPSSAKVWKLRGGESYLYLLDYAGAVNPKTCGVAGQNLALRSASATVDARLRGRQGGASTAKSMEWLDNNYRALATRTGGYTVLQVNWLNDNLAEVPRTQ